jgi:hypothetical protein
MGKGLVGECGMLGMRVYNRVASEQSTEKS